MNKLHLARLAGVAGVLCASSAVAAEIVLDLRVEALLSRPGVTLADVAQVRAPTAALQAALERLPLGRAPQAGYMDLRTRAELDALLKSQGMLFGHTIAWQGAASVKLRTESAQLAGSRITEAAGAALESAFRGQYDRLDIAPLTSTPDVLVPVGEIRLAARPVDRLRGRTAIWVDVYSGGSVCRSVLVPMSVAAWRMAPVAVHALAAGGVIGKDDVEWRMLDTAGLADEPATRADFSAPLRLRHGVPSGGVLWKREMVGAGTVLRGERVRLLAGGDGVLLELPAVAEADATAGQMVRVRTEPSGAALLARVAEPGVVRLDGR